MAKPPRDLAPSIFSTYFITSTTHGGRPILQSDRMASLLLDTLFHYRREAKFWLHEYVIMPNHIHLLITPCSGLTIEKVMQFIKGGFSYRVRKELGLTLEVWERGYVDHRIRDAPDFQQHVAYIRDNPVRAGLVPDLKRFRIRRRPARRHWSRARSG